MPRGAARYHIHTTTPMRSLTRCAIVAISLALASSRAQAAPRQTDLRTPTKPASSQIQITLQPARDAAGNVAAINVRYVITDTGTAIREFRAAVVLNNLPGIADRMEQFRVTDRAGNVPLTVVDDTPDSTATGFMRHWRVGRALALPVEVRYRAVVAPRRFRAGPPMDLRTYAGGVSGRGPGFLALPDDNRLYHILLHWDLTLLGKGAIGASSLADGDADTEGPLSLLNATFFMAGQLGRYPVGGNTGAFSAYWAGESPSLQMQDDMQWSSHAYDALSRFFGDTAVRPYRLFLRVLPETTTSGGNAGYRSFMIQVPLHPPVRPTGAAPSLRGVLAHEMIHGWAGGPGGGQWSTEGLTTFYTAYVQLRTGLQPVEEFVRDVNRISRDYYANPYRNASGEAAAAAFWADKNGEVLPYNRGALYFFDVDDKLRKATGGRRTLAQEMFDLNRRRSGGENVTVQSWIETLRGALGAAAVADFDSIIVRGTKTVVLAPDAFGPCFERRIEKHVRPDFAFDRRVPEARTVVSLVPGSAASIAGLRNGDVVLTPLAVEVLTSPEARKLALDITRNGMPLNIQFLSSPALVDVYLWSRVPGVDERVCRGS